MKLLCGTKEEAQEICDRIHAEKQRTDSFYATSVADGQTLRWAFPENIDGKWFVEIDQACRYFLTDKEIEQFPAWDKALQTGRAG